MTGKMGGCSKSKKTLNAKVAKRFRKERKTVILRHLFFAHFAKKTCAFAVKDLTKYIINLK
jgi:nicotinamide riboside kinase